MANTTNTRHTCQECGHCHMGLCTKSNQAVRATQYACHRFQTLTQIKEEREARLQARLRKEEQRLNFILTALYISTTSSMQLLEYFDAQFQDRKAESNWRFARKRAANEIDRAVQRIRDIYQHSFMVDQTQVMTKHGKEAFDVEAYDKPRRRRKTLEPLPLPPHGRMLAGRSPGGPSPEILRRPAAHRHLRTERL